MLFFLLLHKCFHVLLIDPPLVRDWCSRYTETCEMCMLTLYESQIKRYRNTYREWTKPKRHLSLKDRKMKCAIFIYKEISLMTPRGFHRHLILVSWKKFGCLFYMFVFMNPAAGLFSCSNMHLNHLTKSLYTLNSKKWKYSCLFVDYCHF